MVQRFCESTDIPTTVVTFPTPRGPAVARNHGAREADSTLLLFVDSDVVLDRETVAHLTRRIEDQNGRGAVVSIYHERNAAGGILSDFTTTYSAYNYLSGSPDRPSHFSSQCVLINREDFEEVGGFNERFGAATVEDIELGWRLRAASLPVVAEPAARVTHNSRYDFGRFVRNYWCKCFDFAPLFLRRIGSTGTTRGYGGSHDAVSILLVSLFALSLCGLIWSARLFLVAFLLGLAIACHWRRFVNTTKNHFGLGRVPANVLLKALMLLICAAASIVSLATLPFRRPPGIR
jgi:hypothetical protein